MASFGTHVGAKASRNGGGDTCRGPLGLGESGGAVRPRPVAAAAGHAIDGARRPRVALPAASVAYDGGVPPSLSVVIPVYNEPAWIGQVVADLVVAVERSSFAAVELIAVDDGSDEPTRDALLALSTPFPMRVLRQPNQGRFAARRTGIEAASGDLVLLLDSRVSIRPDALEFVVSEMERTGPAPIWTAHVDYELGFSPFGRIWCVLEFLAWRDYLRNPRTLSYGLEDYDRYPKGTTCFIAPRASMLEAIESFHSYFEDLREANDDTTLIRPLAARQPINISPGFSCLYRPRTKLRPFMRHAFHRGGVFVDGYGRPGSRFFAVIAAFYPLSALTAVLALRHRRRALGAAAAAPLAGAGAGIVLRRPAADALALAMVGPLWLIAFAAGMWRGLWLASLALLRRAR